LRIVNNEYAIHQSDSQSDCTAKTDWTKTMLLFYLFLYCFYLEKVTSYCCDVNECFDEDCEQMTSAMNIIFDYKSDTSGKTPCQILSS